MSKAFSCQKGRTQPHFDPFKPFHCSFYSFFLEIPYKFQKIEDYCIETAKIATSLRLYIFTKLTFYLFSCKLVAYLTCKSPIPILFAAFYYAIHRL
jgi:hypothetical protein